MTTSPAPDRVEEPAAGRRRGFVGVLGAAFAAALGWLLLRPGRARAHTPHHEAPAGPRKPKWGMVIDLDMCTGCQGCVVACRQENNVPVAGPVKTAQGRAMFWMDMVTVTEGEYPHVKTELLPAPCYHCDDPPCTKVCPVGATSKSDEGIVQQIPRRCIGCRMCANACPYTRRYFNWGRPKWPDELKGALNPEVSTRTHGVVEKCTFCHHRLYATRERVRMEGRTLTDADVRRLPACADACPAEAITFGDINDPDSEVSRLRAGPRAFVLLEELGTHPKVVYLRSQKWGT